MNAELPLAGLDYTTKMLNSESMVANSLNKSSTDNFDSLYNTMSKNSKFKLNQNNTELLSSLRSKFLI